MVDLSIHPNWARSSSSQRSMAYTIIIFGKLHEYSGPTTVGISRHTLGMFLQQRPKDFPIVGKNVDNLDRHR